MKKEPSSSAASRIRVVVRIRPPSSTLNLESKAEFISKLQLSKEKDITLELNSTHQHEIHARRKKYTFGFDHVFHSSATQDVIHKSVGLPCVQSLLEGYNSTIFAYGQTGSGKTFTMYGDNSEVSREWKEDSLSEFDGLVPRISAALLARINEDSPRRMSRPDNRSGELKRKSDDKVDRIRGPGADSESSSPSSASSSLTRPTSSDEAEEENDDIVYVIKCSFLEIYNDSVRDLLVAPSRSRSRQSLQVRETPRDGVWVEGATYAFVSTAQEIANIVRTGLRRRTVASTRMNEVSSRSHCIFTLHLYQSGFSDGTTKTSSLHLVDLAGSERVLKSGVLEDARDGRETAFTEAKNINQSLTSLGSCIHALTESNRKHIPYRDSKLTHMLKESLGGNSLTCLIATVSPLSSDCTETLSTLRFASRAKTVEVHAQKNIQKSAAQLAIELATIKRIVATLENENDSLRVMLQHKKVDSVGNNAKCAELAKVATLESTVAALLAECASLRSAASSAERQRRSLEDETEILREAVASSRTDSVRDLSSAWSRLRERESQIAARETKVERERHAIANTTKLRLAEEKALSAKRVELDRREADIARRTREGDAAMAASSTQSPSSSGSDYEKVNLEAIAVDKCKEDSRRDLRAFDSRSSDRSSSLSPSYHLTAVEERSEKKKSTTRDSRPNSSSSSSSNNNSSNVEVTRLLTTVDNFDKLWEDASRTADLKMLSSIALPNRTARPQSAYDHAKFLSASLREKREQLRSQLETLRMSSVLDRSKGSSSRKRRGRKRIVRVVGSRRCEIEDSDGAAGWEKGEGNRPDGDEAGGQARIAQPRTTPRGEGGHTGLNGTI